MIRLKKDSKIQLVKNEKTSVQINVAKTTGSAALRPEIVDAKVYKVKSAFIKNAIFVTLSYIDTSIGRRPIEIFINSKDLNKSAEYVVLTRLISAIFRRATDPMFILEELHGILDPNGGSFKGGKYYPSFYAELADVIEQFFYDVNIIEENNDNKTSSKNQLDKELIKVENQPQNNKSNLEMMQNREFKICPECNNRGLKTENGCDSCCNCGYSKCDK